MLDKETMEKLLPYEKDLKYAVRSNFVNMRMSDFEKVAEIYNGIYTPLRKGQMSCGSCRLQALRKIGEDYLKTKEFSEELAKKKAMKEKEKEEVENTAPQTPKKKAGRPKKIELDKE
jgi:hypothetical protein